MKNLSIILTLLLVIFISASLYTAWIVYGTLTTAPFNYVVIWRLLNPVYVYGIFLIISIYLNIKKLYLYNSLICGTLLVSDILLTTAKFITASLLHTK